MKLVSVSYAQSRLIDHRTLTRLKSYRDRLTVQQYKTLRGQVLAGDSEGAMKGLLKILKWRNNN